MSTDDDEPRTPPEKKPPGKPAPPEPQEPEPDGEDERTGLDQHQDDADVGPRRCPASRSCPCRSWTSTGPSIQLGLLKAIARGARLPGPDPARQPRLRGPDRRRTTTELLAEHRGRLVGDWLFSRRGVRRRRARPGGELLDEFAEELPAGVAGRAAERLLRLRDDDVPAYLDALVDGVPVGRAATSSASARTFQQNTASFALARRLKQRYPDIVTVFGGANFDGEMGLELVRVGRLRRLRGHRRGRRRASRRCCARWPPATDPGDGPGRGVAARRRRSSARRRRRRGPRSTTCRSPDYGEYFERAERPGPAAPTGTARGLPFESARGCWWGAKHHCTFCGLNGDHDAVPRQVAASGCSTSWPRRPARYRSFRFEAVDNILDPQLPDDAASRRSPRAARLPDLLRGQGEPDPRRSSGSWRRAGVTGTCSPASSR